MESALDFSRPRPQVKWNSDPETKVFLCVLFKFFEKDLEKYAKVFNARFEAKLLQWGYINRTKVPKTTLVSQWYDMRKKGNPVWGMVHLSPFTQDPWQHVIEEIRTAARSIGLDISLKAVDDVDASGFVYQPSLNLQLQSPQTSPQDEPEHCSPRESQHDSTQHCSQRWEDNDDSPLTIAGGKICLWCHLEDREQEHESPSGRQPEKVPPLLYRWWNADSQGKNSDNFFLAGLFLSTSQSYFRSENIRQEQFDEYFLKHIRIEKTPSPFISTYKSMLAPVHRAVRNQQGASISILDTRKIMMTTKIFSAQDYVLEHQVKIGTYTGVGEYLVWGEIPKNAIICTVKITKLLEIANQEDDIGKFLQLAKISLYKKARKPLHRAMAKDAVYLDGRAGAAVGKLLSILEVRPEYCKEISMGLAYSWRVKRRDIPWRDFIRGVKVGYWGQLLLSSVRLPLPGDDDSSDDTPFSGSDYDDIDDDNDDDNEDNDNTSLHGDGNGDADDSSTVDDTWTMANSGEVLVTARSPDPPVVDLDRSGPHDSIVLYSSDQEMGDNVTDKGEEDLNNDELVQLERLGQPGDRFATDRARVRFLLADLERSTAFSEDVTML